MVRRVARIVRRAALVGLAVGATFAPAPVHAENSLEHSIPAANTTVAKPPASLQLGFKDRLGGGPTVVLTCGGAIVPTGQPVIGEGLSTVNVQVVGEIPPGASCTVGWKVNDVDGKQNGTGHFSFNVAKATGTTTAGKATGTTTAPVDANATAVTSASGSLRGPLGLARLVTSLGLAMLFGALVLIAMAWPEGPEYILTVRYVRTACAIAITGAFATVVVLAAIRSGGGLSSGLSPSAWLDVKDLPGGGVALARLALCVASIWVAIRPDRVTDSVYQLQALAAPTLAVATIGMSRGTGVGLPIIGAGIVHALAMAVWFGGLALLARVVLVGSGEEDLVHAVRGFQRISFPAIAVTAVSGLVLVHQLDWGKLFDSTHGRLVLIKVVAVAVMIFIGVATREFIRERLSRVDTLSAGLAGRLQRAVSLEALAGIAILGITAGLTSVAPPGLEKPPVVIPDLASGRYEITNKKEDFVAQIRLTERLGPNAVWIRIISPKSGLQNVALKFIPPAETPGGQAVILRVPLTGAGVAMIDKSQNMPLNVPGTWEVICYVNDTLMGSVRVTVKSALGAGTTAKPPA